MSKQLPIVSESLCCAPVARAPLTEEQSVGLARMFKAIADPIIVCTHAQTTEAILAPKQIGEFDLQRCEEIGATLAAGLSLGIY